MTASKPPSDLPPDLPAGAAAREARRAQALRANLRRRKADAPASGAESLPAPEASAEDGDSG
jgi:hypothetical protein